MELGKSRETKPFTEIKTRYHIYITKLIRNYTKLVSKIKTLSGNKPMTGQGLIRGTNQANALFLARCKIKTKTTNFWSH